MRTSRVMKGLCFIFILLILVSCSEKKVAVKQNNVSKEEKKEAIPKEDKVPSDKELMAVIEKNKDAFNAENINAYMATIHPLSPAYENAKNQTQLTFDTYDLEIELLEFKILEKTAKEAVLEVIQLTMKIDGPEFQNNITTGVHTLRPDKGTWKIVSTQAVETQYVDDWGLPIDENAPSNDTANNKYRDIMEQLTFYVDDRQWKEANYIEYEDGAAAEFILAEENLNNWTEMYTIDYFENSSANVHQYVENYKSILEESIQGEFYFQVIEESENEIIFEFMIANDPVELDQDVVARVFSYEGHLFLLTYTVIGTPMEESYLLHWIELLKSAEFQSETL